MPNRVFAIIQAFKIYLQILGLQKGQWGRLKEEIEGGDWMGQTGQASVIPYDAATKQAESQHITLLAFVKSKLIARVHYLAAIIGVTDHRPVRCVAAMALESAATVAFGPEVSLQL